MQKTQLAQIKAHLSGGKTITPLEALGVYGCFRLAARIEELRRRHNMVIHTDIREDAKGHKYARYSLDKSAHGLACAV